MSESLIGCIAVVVCLAGAVAILFWNPSHLYKWVGACALGAASLRIVALAHLSHRLDFLSTIGGVLIGALISIGIRRRQRTRV